MHWNGLIYIIVWDEVKTCNLEPTPTSLVFFFKNNGLVNQDDMEKLDWLFNKFFFSQVHNFYDSKKCHNIYIYIWHL